MDVTPIPEGYHSITPYLVINNANEAVKFYTEVFGAKERLRLDDGSGKVMHLELEIGSSVIMMADEFPEMGFTGPQTIGGTPVSICHYVEDCDQVFNKAIQNGAEVMRPLADQFYGDRSGTFKDPFGHVWTVCSRIEIVSNEDIQKRFQEFQNNPPS